MTLEAESQLNALEKQLVALNDMLLELSTEMIDGKYTPYPMYLAHQEEAKIGEMIVDRTEFGFPFSINASTVERFLELGIIQKERLGGFLKTYGNPKKKCCVFLMAMPEPQFVFYAFKKASKTKPEKPALSGMSSP
ncbi:MAG: hypothetical protein O3B82_00950 [Bacteroidetes bacterium]|nr:hypothetical protein [Bacteroidota bacterium]MSP57331.1 hypothetical protein [Flavobacteriaceae bacterium]PHX92536.1 MAG: hypothetical protein CK532_02795 [Flavobacteriales bacterium]